MSSGECFRAAVSQTTGSSLQRQLRSGAVAAGSQREAKPVAAGVTGDDRSLPHCTRVQVSLSGLEPETYGLKVRCSTD